MKAILRSAWVVDPKERTGRRWDCPNCGGDCFGSSGSTYHCQGNSLGTPTEQTRPCGYSESWYDPRAPKDLNVGTVVGGKV